MDIGLLKTYIVVVKHGSVSKAAKELYLTQPAVTKQIRVLEREYGTRIFERERNRLFLTDEGKVLLSYAYRIVELYTESHLVINEQGDKVKGSLRIGANLTLGIYLLPKLIKQFADIYPDVKFDIFLDNTGHVIEAIKGGGVELGFIGVVPKELSLVTYPFYRDCLKVVISPKLGFKKRTIGWEELEKTPFIGREEGSDIRAAYEEWFKDRPIKLVPKIEINNTETIKFSIQCGLGFSILPRCTIEEEVRQGILQTLSLPYFNPVQQFYICHYKGKKFSKSARVFFEFIFSLKEKGREEAAAP